MPSIVITVAPLTAIMKDQVSISNSVIVIVIASNLFIYRLPIFKQEDCLYATSLVIRRMIMLSKELLLVVTSWCCSHQRCCYYTGGGGRCFLEMSTLSNFECL